MWSSKALRKSAFLALVCTCAPVLGSCSSFTPVYSGALAAQPELEIAYAKPNSRLEQIIYQDLSLRLGKSADATAPLAQVNVSRAVSYMALSQTQGSRRPIQIVLTATLSIAYRDGSQTPPLTITRRATANYTSSGQIVSDNAAAEDAAERAATAVAESLRLAVLAELSRR